MGPRTRCPCGRFLGMMSRKRMVQPFHERVWYCSLKCERAYKEVRRKKIQAWLDAQ